MSYSGMSMTNQTKESTTFGASTSLYNALPDNARVYYRPPQEDIDLNDLGHERGFLKSVKHALGLGLIYPLFSMTYLAANEVMVILENGKHKIKAGPGLKWVN